MIIAKDCIVSMPYIVKKMHRLSPKREEEPEMVVGVVDHEEVVDEHPRVIIEPANRSVVEFRSCEVLRTIVEPQQCFNGTINSKEEDVRFMEGCREEQLRELREQQRVAIELCRPGLQVVALPPVVDPPKEFRAPAPLVSSTSPGVITHCTMRPPPPPPPKPSRHNIERSVPHEEPSSSIPDLGEIRISNLSNIHEVSLSKKSKVLEKFSKNFFNYNL